MTTSRVQWANALLPAIQAPRTSDAMQVVIAWQMMEGQTAGENDPLAHINTGQPHGTGGTSDSFSFASIDTALAVSAASMMPGRNYAPIGDAFRAGKSAADLITAIGKAGWCGSPTNPCPGYAAGIRANFNRLADPNVYAREANVLVGSTSLSGAAGTSTPATGASVPALGGTATDVLSPGDLVGPLLGPLGGLLTGPGQVIGNATAAVGAIGTVFAHLLDPGFWKRVGVFGAGATLAVIAALMLGKTFAPNLTSTVKDGVMAAGAAAAAF